MHRIIPSFLMIAAAILASSCERGATPSTAIGGSASALVGDETTADTESESIETPVADPVADVAPVVEMEQDEEIPIPPLAVAWADGAEIASSATASFSVTNASDEELTFSTSLVSVSMIGNGSIALGESSLAPGASTSFTVGAADLPVRSEHVVGQIFVQLTRTIATPDGTREVTVITAGRYYLHGTGMGQFRAFTEKALQEELGGTTMQLSFSSEKLAIDTASILGELSDGEGGFESVTAETGDAILRNDSGEVVGYRSAVRRSAVGDSGDEAAAAMEVSDE